MYLWSEPPGRVASTDTEVEAPRVESPALKGGQPRLHRHIRHPGSGDCPVYGEVWGADPRLKDGVQEPPSAHFGQKHTEITWISPIR